MSLVFIANTANETSTTGTGTYRFGETFGGNSFSAVTLSDTFYYTVTDGSSYECGLGTKLSGNYIARTTIYVSSNSNNPVVWVSGSKSITMTQATSQIPILSINAGTNITITGATRATISASENSNYVAVTATYSVLTTDDVVEATANTFTITLPTAVGLTGKQFIIKNSGTGIITVDADGAETIDGNLDIGLNQYDSLSVVSNNVNWGII